MKAVFPCKGVVVLTKKDIQTLESFYQTTLITSKMFEMYNTTEYMVQVGNFNYLPPRASIIVDEKNLLTISKLRSVMDAATSTKKESSEASIDEFEDTISNPLTETEDTLSDNDILSHPFFQTLKPID